MLQTIQDDFFNSRYFYLQSFRRELHRHPELGFEEYQTSKKVMQELDRLGISYVSDIAGTGIVATIKGNLDDNNRSIGLRADMDALPLAELSEVAYASEIKGKMHACGHDGHTVILLGVAAWFAEHRDFSGTLHLVFQPAEEGLGGGQQMVKEGLFERFPMDEIYALHNWPELPFGKVGICSGPIMAAADQVKIKVQGRGGHGGVNPHRSIDPVRMAGTLIQALHSVVSRDVDPIASAVLSLCGIQGGTLDGFAVIPDEVNISGTVRTLDDNSRTTIENAMARVCEGVSHAYGGEVFLDYQRLFPVTVNSLSSVCIVESCVEAIWGRGALVDSVSPSLGAEDFSFMLKECPGAYFFLGTGEGDKCHPLHSAHFDFNDRIIPYGSRLLVEIAMKALINK
ncbi:MULTISPECIES: amidohydrolase [Halomonadaceae]|uniref:Amidohydrolase n=2 Tax=Vreelandella TaxID=3137766 RepID=A0A7Z0RZ21_9GAMM|nr:MULTISPECIES: amidohydrolase [Halomonas]NYS78393.1 amidohydrolase [Halomonas glaciei]|tara:strand:- start:6051 stop:7244 length:1194 start_codon:yes stop_codon:yes gene_type:complete